MAFTTNINQANLQAQRDTVAQARADERLRKSQEFQAVEAEKGRAHAEKMFNLGKADAFDVSNPTQSLSQEQIDDLGEDVYNVYGVALEEIKQGRELIYSGDTKKRIQGQQIISRANKRLSELKFDYKTLEEDTQEYLKGNQVGTAADVQTRAIAEAFVNGKVKIVSSKTAGKDLGDSGRYIQWEDKDGNIEYKSFKEHRDALNNGIERVDLDAFAKSVKDRISTSKRPFKGGTKEAMDEDNKAIDVYIDDLLSDPKNVEALGYQLKGEGDLKTQLKDMLIDAYGVQITPERPVSTGSDSAKDKLSNIQGMRAQRHYDIRSVLDAGSPEEATNAMRGLVKNRAIEKGEGITGASVADVTYDEAANEMVISFMEDSESDYRVGFDFAQINQALTKFTPIRDAQNLSTAAVASADPVNYIESGLTSAGEASGNVITNTFANQMNTWSNEDNDGVINTNRFVKSLKNKENKKLLGRVLEEKEITHSASSVLDRRRVSADEGDIIFRGTTYKVNAKDKSKRKIERENLAKAIGEAYGTFKERGGRAAPKDESKEDRIKRLRAEANQ